jgi:hypothetical protein
MLSSVLSQLQSRVTEYPGFSSLRSDAMRFHETATGAHETSQFLVTQTWVTGEAFQSMIRDFDDIDRIRHELNLVPTTEVASSSATTIPIDSRNPNFTATPTVSSSVGSDFTGFPLDHHSTHKAASNYVQPFKTAIAESGATHGVGGFKLSTGVQWWIFFFGLAFGLVIFNWVLYIVSLVENWRMIGVRAFV